MDVTSLFAEPMKRIEADPGAAAAWEKLKTAGREFYVEAWPLLAPQLPEILSKLTAAARRK